MATPGMSWQQQHGYGGGSAPAAAAGKFGAGPAPGAGAEHSPELHFKMSKKIAQLTKVRLAPLVPCVAGGKGEEPVRRSRSVDRAASVLAPPLRDRVKGCAQTRWF